MTSAEGAQVRLLLDRDQIQELLFAYCRYADVNDPAGLATCFTEDCVARYGPGPPSIGSEARRLQAERDLALFDATSHHLSNVSIEHLDSDRAGAESVFYAWHRLAGSEEVWELWGRYRDVLMRTADGWRIAERTLLMTDQRGFPADWEWLRLERAPSGRGQSHRPPAGAEQPSATMDPDAPSVTRDRDGPILLIAVGRPRVRNAFDREVATSVSAALDELEADDELRVGILHGAGGVFSAGMDMKAFLFRGEIPATEQYGLLGLVRRQRSKPLIAAVDGYAIAAGFEVALACDLIVAGRDARFELPEVKRGLVPAGGALRNLPLRAPLNLAAELALTGGPLSARRAHAIGLVARLAEPGDARDTAITLAHEIAANAPAAVRAIKAVLDRQHDWPPGEFWRRQEEIVGDVQRGEDATEGASAFLAGRPPRWQDR
jgi:enoyl-CoA hydratase